MKSSININKLIIIISIIFISNFVFSQNSHQNRIKKFDQKVFKKKNGSDILRPGIGNGSGTGGGNGGGSGNGNGSGGGGNQTPIPPGIPFLFIGGMIYFYRKHKH